MQEAPIPPQASQGAPAQAPSEGQGGAGDALTNMIIQTDQALTKISQVIGKSSPQAADALAQINEQYRQIISSVMNGGGAAKGPQQQAAPQMASPETHGKPSSLAY